MVDATREPGDPTPVGDLIGETLAASQPFELHAPCTRCGCTTGISVEKNGQDVVYCAACGAHAGYNRSKTESGKAPRTIPSLHRIPPSQAARIKERATARCELCGNRPPDHILNVSHILSIADGLISIEDGLLTERELRSDDNLILLCEACNSGFGRRSLPVRLFVALLRARLVEPRRGRAG
jgi:hypothetical protein